MSKSDEYQREEITLRNPLMILWAQQCIDSQQILWRKGYPQVMVMLSHDGKTGIAATVEITGYDT